jgi:hypothetical protein
MRVASVSFVFKSVLAAEQRVKVAHGTAVGRMSDQVLSPGTGRKNSKSIRRFLLLHPGLDFLSAAPVGAGSSSFLKTRLTKARSPRAHRDSGSWQPDLENCIIQTPDENRRVDRN